MNTEDVKVSEAVVIAPKGYSNFDCELEMTFTLEGTQKFVDFGKQYLSKEQNQLELILISVWLDGDLSVKGVSISEQEMRGNVVRVEMPHPLWKYLTGFGKEKMNQRLLDIAEMREKEWE